VTHVVSRRQRPLSHAPSNKRMKLTRGEGGSHRRPGSGARGILSRRAQLIRVFYAPREDLARELVGSKSPLPYQTHDRAGSTQRGARLRT